jgi:hypothetical protein
MMTLRDLLKWRLKATVSVAAATPSAYAIDVPYATRPPVLVVGASSSVKTFLEVLVSFGFRPVALYSRNGAFEAGTNLPIDMSIVRLYATETGVAPPSGSVAVPVLDQSGFADMANREPVPIFVADIERGGVEQFKEELRYLRYRMRLFDQRILHPAALAGLHPFRARTFMFTGFPSSGNMIFQRCLNEVLAENPGIAHVQRSPLERLLSQYALSHWQTLSEIVATHFDESGLYVHMGSPCGFGLGGDFLELESPEPAMAGFFGRAGDVIVGGVRMWHHAWASPYHASHEPITLGAAKAYRTRNVDCVQIVRHPLDVLVSIAGKLTYHSRSDALSEKDARAAAVTGLMNCDVWVHSMIDALERYYVAVVAAKDHIHLLAYENLLSEPVLTIQRMATMFGGSVSADAAGRIWRKWADEPAAGGGHRWEPGAGKWKRFLPARFANRLIGSKLEAAAATLGYTFERDGFQGPDGINENVMLNDRLIALEEGRYNLLVGKDVVLLHDGAHRGINPETGMFISGPLHAQGAIERVLHSPIVKDILVAGTYFNVSPHMSMLEYLSQTAPEMDMSSRWLNELKSGSGG